MAWKEYLTEDQDVRVLATGNDGEKGRMKGGRRKLCRNIGRKTALSRLTNYLPCYNDKNALNLST